jgi:hypothetical protein
MLPPMHEAHGALHNSHGGDQPLGWGAVQVEFTLPIP